MPAKISFLCFLGVQYKVAQSPTQRINSPVTPFLLPSLSLITAFNFRTKSVSSAELFLLDSDQRSAEREEIR